MHYPSATGHQVASSTDPLVAQRVIGALKAENVALRDAVSLLEQQNEDLRQQLDRVLPVLAALRRSMRAAKLETARTSQVVDLTSISSAAIAEVIDLEDEAVEEAVPATTAATERPSVARRRLRRSASTGG